MRPLIISRAHHPLSPACPIHLRRICGVCQKFEARSIQTTARCQEFGAMKNGMADAADCEFWTRKAAGKGVR